MSIHAFHRDLAIPAGANHLRQAECVIRVGFVDLQAEGRLGVPGVHADHGHAASAQAERQPIGQLSGLQTNPHRAWRMAAQSGGNRVGVGTALPAPDDSAGIIDDADRGRLERNVELVRYIDEFVICFQYRSDAIRVQDPCVCGWENSALL